jgi:hypothetical protein
MGPFRPQTINEGVRIMRIFTIGVFACVAAAAACSSNNESITVPTLDAAIPEFDAGAIIEAAAPHEAAAPIEEAAAPKGDTFTLVYSDIISPICVQCHNPAGIGVSMGHLDMSTKAAAFADLVNVSAMGVACGGMGTRIVPGNADDSILYKKVDPAQGAPCGSKMPLGLTPLTTAQADEIKSWINAGALND